MSQEEPGFVVRFNARSVDDAELLADMQRVAEDLGVSALTRSQYDAHGHYHPTTIHRRLGGWTGACEAAGLASGRPDLGHDGDVWMENIAEVWTASGRQPSYGDMRGSKFSPEGYANRYGSWTSALVRFSEWIKEAGPSVASRPSDVAPRDHVRRRTGRTPSLRLRFAVLQRDRFTCRSCGRSPSISPEVTLHVDHVIPYSEGGETVAENLQSLCQECNLGKTNSLP